MTLIFVVFGVAFAVLVFFAGREGRQRQASYAPKAAAWDRVAQRLGLANPQRDKAAFGPQHIEGLVEGRRVFAREHIGRTQRNTQLEVGYTAPLGRRVKVEVRSHGPRVPGARVEDIFDVAGEPADVAATLTGEVRDALMAPLPDGAFLMSADAERVLCGLRQPTGDDAVLEGVIRWELALAVALERAAAG